MSFINTDLTKIANLSEHSTGTGSVRKSKPEYVDFFHLVITLVQLAKISKNGFL
jgi:prenyltransferase beta subunit